MTDRSSEHYHFVTGRLAEQALREVVSKLSQQLGFRWSVDVLPITVAALMTPEWIARRIQPPPETTRVIIPGYCGGELAVIEAAVNLPVEKGPRDLGRLPEHFGKTSARDDAYGAFDIQIIAEINHAPRQSFDAIRQQALKMRADGADLIDVGSDPGQTWPRVGDCVKMLRDEGLRVSIDSFNTTEVAAATAAGAELVLSVNAANREAAPDWGSEVVVIPDTTESLASLPDTIEFLDQRNVPYRLDPILAPIGTGFADSLGRYLETRRLFPEAEMMMGVGNLTELTDADSAPINVLLLGFCQEVGIRSVLTTQVIPWAASCVRELDLARRLVKYAVDRGGPPKHLEPNLVLLRDPARVEQGEAQLKRLAGELKDANYRLFAEAGEIHLVSRGLHLHDADPFALFAKLLETKPDNVDAGHAFYLGFEMGKALTANTLGKHYDQDNALDWGFLTAPEDHHRLERTSKARRKSNE